MDSFWKFVVKQDSLAKEYSEKLNIDFRIIQLALNRGLNSLSDIEQFLNPNVKYLSTVFCEEEILRANQRIISAIKQKEKIIVYGDYDVDGVTGTVVLIDALKSLGAMVAYYVPSRYNEGYGLNISAVKQFKEQKISLIVTVDCGISNFEEIKYAKEAGIDVIVTDHHTPPEILPPALAIINPKIEDAANKLAGVGVAYRFVHELIKAYYHKDILKNKKYMELVAIGTVTDVVPLLGDNRILVKNGLDRLNMDKSMGLYYLLERADVKVADTITIGYFLGPRINAAGRLDSASLAIELLTTTSKDYALRLADRLNELNELRKEEGNKIFVESTKILEHNPDLLDSKVIVLSSKDWEPGVIGIVASQLAKKFTRPVVLISMKSSMVRGSIRSFAGVDVLTPLKMCEKLLINYGGHIEAAGFEINIEYIAKFSAKYISILNKLLEQQELFTEIMIDYELNHQDLTLDFFQKLQILEPFGEANREPVFITKNLNAINYYLVGKNKNHLKILFSQDFDFQIEAIGFNMADYERILEKYSSFDVVYNLACNYYFGQKTLQLKLVDLRPSASLPPSALRAPSP